MPRTARQKSTTGVYYVMLRGIEKLNIFEDSQDYLRYLDYIRLAREKTPFVVYAYCLTPTGTHMLIKVPQDLEIGRLMSRITVGYVQYYNHKFNRTGHLFRNRFKSLTVETDDHFLSLFRDIHQRRDNPWNSYRAYMGRDNRIIVNKVSSYLDVSFVLGMFEDREEFVSFMESGPT